MKYPLESKHHFQAQKFARLQGLDIGSAMKWEQLHAVIAAAFPGITEFELEDDEPEVPVVIDGVTGQVSTHYRFDPLVTVNIQNNNENGGVQPVPVCCNGDHITIMRNMDVPIPYRFWRVLEDAVETNYRQVPNHATGKPDTIVEQRRSYQYSSSGVPSAEEIAAWHERTRDIGRDKGENKSLKTQGAAVDAIAGALLKRLTEGAGQPA